jgi:hypothetical protein
VFKDISSERSGMHLEIIHCCLESERLVHAGIETPDDESCLIFQELQPAKKVLPHTVLRPWFAAAHPVSARQEEPLLACCAVPDSTQNQPVRVLLLTIDVMFRT